MNNSKAGVGMNRRRFLTRSAGWAGGAAAFPLLLPGGVFGGEGTVGANDRIGVAFIGMGRQAGGLLQGLLRRPEARLVAVADVDLSRARGATAKHGGEALQDYRRLLERKDVDAVITATPEQWRGPICIHSCQAGKDVYAEKPLSWTIREGRLIVQAARKYGRVFQVGSQQRSMVRNWVGCEFIRSGKLGRITRVVAHNYPTPWEGRLPAQPVPSDLDWDMWCGPVEPVPYNRDLFLPRANPGWLSFRSFSGGEMTGWGSHGFDQVQWALGMDASGPIEVWVEGPRFDPPTYEQPEPKARGDRQCSVPKVFFRYEGDIVMELGDGPEGGAVFHGEKGTVRIDRGVFESDPEEYMEEALRNRPKGMNEDHMKDWLTCIRTRGKPVADVEIGHRSATVCHLGNIARWAGRRLRWDPARETFPDDPDACRYLDRPRRKGYDLPATL
ncbi:MAG TPA: Gfo/Idh/MocA family oxidoreductase [Verrucomicrobiota bacterium]|nr:Gfo/Idh/MocA family oxidoreductase [Verrucomicrobiota bacterium]